MVTAAAIAVLALAACGGATAPTTAPTAAPTTAPTAAPASITPVAAAAASVAPEASADPICIDAGDGGAPVCGRQAAAPLVWSRADVITQSTGREAAGGVKRVCIEADPSGGGTDPKLALAPVVGDPVRVPVGRQICVGGAGGQPLGGTLVQLQPVGAVPGEPCVTCWIVKAIDQTTIRAFWQDADGTPRTTDITPGKKTTIEPGGVLTYTWLGTTPEGSLMLCIAGG